MTRLTLAGLILWGSITPSTMLLYAQTASAVLVEKARALEGRGRPDLAAQTWQQVLLSDPKHQEALATLARFAKQSGKADEARESTYLRETILGGLQISSNWFFLRFEQEVSREPRVLSGSCPVLDSAR